MGDHCETTINPRSSSAAALPASTAINGPSAGRRRAWPSLALGAVAGAALGWGMATWVPGIRVVDGDTVDHGWWRWRLAGHDAPEVRRAGCQAERKLGLRARNRLEELTLAAGLDWALKAEPGRDPYHRRIGRLIVSGADAGETLIAEGLARPYTGGRRAPWCPAP